MGNAKATHGGAPHSHFATLASRRAEMSTLRWRLALERRGRRGRTPRWTSSAHPAPARRMVLSLKSQSNPPLAAAGAGCPRHHARDACRRHSPAKNSGAAKNSGGEKLQEFENFGACFATWGRHCAAHVNRADKTHPVIRASFFLLTRSLLDRPRLCSRVGAALGRTSGEACFATFWFRRSPVLGIAAPNTHRFAPGVHVAGFGCTGNVVRAVRIQPLIGSPGRRPLPLNRVRRRLDHSHLVAANRALVPTSGAAGVLSRRLASHRSGLRP
jgi:hypothetical protein